jgi:type II secretory pathway pseudopilin PulG
MEKIKTKNKKGFTIVETLVAISVLMIAVAGPLVVANKSLTAALYAKDQMFASYLAQEGVEYLRNVKDNNIANAVGGGWLDSIDSKNNGQGYGHAWGNSCMRTGNGHGQTNDCSIDIMESFGDDSQFRVSYYLIEIIAQKEVALTVTVTWKEGAVSNETDITSELTNAAL